MINPLQKRKDELAAIHKAQDERLTRSSQKDGPTSIDINKASARACETLGAYKAEVEGYIYYNDICRVFTFDYNTETKKAALSIFNPNSERNKRSHEVAISKALQVFKVELSNAAKNAIKQERLTITKQGK